MAEGGEAKWERAPGDRRHGGPLHEEMSSWGEAKKSWQRLTAEDTMSTNQGKLGGRGGEQSYSYSCKRIQKRSDRSCGKVPVRIVKLSVCYSIESFQRVVGSVLIVCFR